MSAIQDSLDELNQKIAAEKAEYKAALQSAIAPLMERIAALELAGSDTVSAADLAVAIAGIKDAAVKVQAIVD